LIEGAVDESDWASITRLVWFAARGKLDQDLGRCCPAKDSSAIDINACQPDLGLINKSCIPPTMTLAVRRDIIAGRGDVGPR